LRYRSEIPKTMAMAAGNRRMRIKMRVRTAPFYRSFPTAAKRE
jgi:hypothetical protein